MILTYLLGFAAGQRMAADHRVSDGRGRQQVKPWRDGGVRWCTGGQAALHRSTAVVRATQDGRRHGRSGRRLQEGTLPLVRPHRSIWAPPVSRRYHCFSNPIQSNMFNSDISTFRKRFWEIRLALVLTPHVAKFRENLFKDGGESWLGKPKTWCKLLIAVINCDALSVFKC